MQTRAVAKVVPGTSAAIVVRGEEPLAVGVVLWRDHASKVFATIVAKVTYNLAEGTSALADKPVPLWEKDEHWDKDPKGGLRFASDLVPFKHTNEVFVVGHAQSQGGVERIIAGGVDKAIAPGAARSSDRSGASLVGFESLSRSSPQRSALFRPQDEAWLLDPLKGARPDGFDPLCLCAAAADQRARDPFLPDEQITLEGLHPSLPRFVTQLGGIRPVLRSLLPSAPLPTLLADTLCIDTDRQVATLTFRGVLPLEEKLVIEVVSRRALESSDSMDSTASLLSTVEAPAKPLALVAPNAPRETTSELDSDAFRAAASVSLPFPPTSEPPRDANHNVEDGALPFKTAAPPRPTSPPPPLAIPPSSPAPPLAMPLTSPSPANFGAEAPASVIPPAPPLTPLVRRQTIGELSLTRPPTEHPKPPEEEKPPLSRLAPPSSKPREHRAGTRRAIVDLLAFEPTVPNRLHKSKVHASLLTEPLRPRLGELGPEDRPRFDVLRVLSCGTPLTFQELQATLEAQLEDPNDFDNPLFLVEGEVTPVMDEVEVLRAAVDIVKPLAASSPRVQSAVTAAEEALSRSVPLLADAANAHFKQLVSALSDLSSQHRHIADEIERARLDARGYKRRTLLGSPRIRGEFTFGRTTVPIYLPDSAGPYLPLLQTFPLVALVEHRPKEDAAEPHPDALIAVALGRVLRSRK